MKTTKTIIPQKTRAVKCVAQIGAYLGVTFTGLEELCDDPKRNESGQEVQAVLTPHKKGFALSGRDGDSSYQIVDDRGRQSASGRSIRPLRGCRTYRIFWQKS